MKKQRVKLKTETISHTVKPQIKELLALASELENRSKANMLEIMILYYCKQKNITKKEEDNGT